MTAFDLIKKLREVREKQNQLKKRLTETAQPAPLPEPVIEIPQSVKEEPKKVEPVKPEPIKEIVPVKEVKKIVKEEKEIKKVTDGLIESPELLSEMKEKSAKRRGRPKKVKDVE